MALDIISCILGGGAIITLITFLIKRGDERKDKKDEVLAEIKAIKKQMAKMERDSVRTQLLMLMNTYTYGEASEILTVAEYVYGKITSDDRPVENVTQWCKRKNCWSGV